MPKEDRVLRLQPPQEESDTGNSETFQISGYPPQALLARCQVGDRESLQELLQWLLPQLNRFLKRRLRGLFGEADIEDVVQDSALTVLRALPNFRGDSSFLTFACGTAWRVAQARRRRLSREINRLERVAALEQPLVAKPSSPHEQSLETSRDAALQRLLDVLPEPQAQALILLAWNLSQLEIAAEIGSPVNTVKQRIRRARARLLKRIEDDPTLLELLGS